MVTQMPPKHSFSVQVRVSVHEHNIYVPISPLYSMNTGRVGFN